MAQNVQSQVVLTADTQQYVQGMNQATQSTKSLGGAVQAYMGQADTLARKNKEVANSFSGWRKDWSNEMRGAASQFSQVAQPLRNAYQTRWGNPEAARQDLNYLRSKNSIGLQEAGHLTGTLFKSGVNDIRGVAQTSITLGKATGEDGAQLGSSLVELGRTFGTSEAAIKNFGDSVVGLANKLGTSATGVTQFAQQLGPIANVAGFTQTQTLGLAGAAARSGQDGFRANNAIGSMMLGLEHANRVSPSNLKKYAQAAGMRDSEFANLSIDEQLVRVIEGTAKGGQRGRDNLSMLGIDGIYGQKALLGLAQSGNIREALGIANSSFGSGEAKTASEASSTLSSQLKRISNIGSMAKESMGAPIEEGLASVAKTFANVAEAAKNLADPFLKLTGIATALAAAGGKVAGAVAGPALAVSGMMMSKGLLKPFLAHTKEGGIADRIPFLGAGASRSEMLKRASNLEKEGQKAYDLAMAQPGASIEDGEEARKNAIRSHSRLGDKVYGGLERFSPSSILRDRLSKDRHQFEAGEREEKSLLHRTSDRRQTFLESDDGKKYLSHKADLKAKGVTQWQDFKNRWSAASGIGNKADIVGRLALDPSTWPMGMLNSGIGDMLGNGPAATKEGWWSRHTNASLARFRDTANNPGTIGNFINAAAWTAGNVATAPFRALAKGVITPRTTIDLEKTRHRLENENKAAFGRGVMTDNSGNVLNHKAPAHVLEEAGAQWDEEHKLAEGQTVSPEEAKARTEQRKAFVRDEKLKWEEANPRMHQRHWRRSLGGILRGGAAVAFNPGAMAVNRTNQAYHTGKAENLYSQLQGEGLTEDQRTELSKKYVHHADTAAKFKESVSLNKLNLGMGAKGLLGGIAGGMMGLLTPAALLSGVATLGGAAMQRAGQEENDTRAFADSLKNAVGPVDKLAAKLGEAGVAASGFVDYAKQATKQLAEVTLLTASNQLTSRATETLAVEAARDKIDKDSFLHEVSFVDSAGKSRAAYERLSEQDIAYQLRTVLELSSQGGKNEFLKQLAQYGMNSEEIQSVIDLAQATLSGSAVMEMGRHSGGKFKKGRENYDAYLQLSLTSDNELRKLMAQRGNLEGVANLDATHLLQGLFGSVIKDDEGNTLAKTAHEAYTMQKTMLGSLGWSRAQMEDMGFAKPTQASWTGTSMSLKAWNDYKTEDPKTLIDKYLNADLSGKDWTNNDRQIQAMLQANFETAREKYQEEFLQSSTRMQYWDPTTQTYTTIPGTSVQRHSSQISEADFNEWLIANKMDELTEVDASVEKMTEIGLSNLSEALKEMLFDPVNPLITDVGLKALSASEVSPKEGAAAFDEIYRALSQTSSTTNEFERNLSGLINTVGFMASAAAAAEGALLTLARAAEQRQDIQSGATGSPLHAITVAQRELDAAQIAVATNTGDLQRYADALIGMENAQASVDSWFVDLQKWSNRQDFQLGVALRRNERANTREDWYLENLIEPYRDSQRQKSIDRAEDAHARSVGYAIADKAQARGWQLEDVQAAREFAEIVKQAARDFSVIMREKSRAFEDGIRTNYTRPWQMQSVERGWAFEDSQQEQARGWQVEDFQRSIGRQQRDRDISRAFQAQMTAMQRGWQASDMARSQAWAMEDYQKNVARAWDDFAKMERRGREDMERSERRGREDLLKAETRGREDLDKSRDRALEDFNRNRIRSEVDFWEQAKRMQIDSAKQIFDYKNRLATDPILSSSGIGMNLADKINQFRQQLKDLDVLRSMGLSSEAIIHLGLNEPQNAQQVRRLVQDFQSGIGPSITQMNALINETLDLSKSFQMDIDSSFVTRTLADFEKQWARAAEDFDRQWYERAEEDFRLSLDRRNEDFELSLLRQAEDFELSLARQREDLLLAQARQLEDMLTQFARQALMMAESWARDDQMRAMQYAHEDAMFAQHIADQEEDMARSWEREDLLKEQRRAHQLDEMRIAWEQEDQLRQMQRDFEDQMQLEHWAHEDAMQDQQWAWEDERRRIQFEREDIQFAENLRRQREQLDLHFQQMREDWAAQDEYDAAMRAQRRADAIEDIHLGIAEAREAYLFEILNSMTDINGELYAGLLVTEGIVQQHKTAMATSNQEVINSMENVEYVAKRSYGNYIPDALDTTNKAIGTVTTASVTNLDGLTTKFKTVDQAVEHVKTNGYKNFVSDPNSFLNSIEKIISGSDNANKLMTGPLGYFPSIAASVEKTASTVKTEANQTIIPAFNDVATSGKNDLETPLTGSFTEVSTGFSSMATSIQDTASGSGESISQTFSGLAAAAETNLRDPLVNAPGVFPDIISGFEDLAQDIHNAVNNDTNGILLSFDTTRNDATDTRDSLVGTDSNSGLFGNIVSGGKTLATENNSSFNAVGGTILNAAQQSVNALNSIGNAFQAFASSLSAFGVSIPMSFGAVTAPGGFNAYAYAEGGVMPGYSPGQDIHTFVSPTGGTLHLSGGEAVMRPEWTAAIGGKTAVDKMNADARAGRPIELPEQRFASGGVSYFLKDWIESRASVSASAGVVDRNVAGTNTKSQHAYGNAVDIWGSQSNLERAFDIILGSWSPYELLYHYKGFYSNGRPYTPAPTSSAALHHYDHIHWSQQPGDIPGMGIGTGGNNPGSGSSGGSGGGYWMNNYTGPEMSDYDDLFGPFKDSVRDQFNNTIHWPHTDTLMDTSFAFEEALREQVEREIELMREAARVWIPGYGGNYSSGGSGSSSSSTSSSPSSNCTHTYPNGSNQCSRCGSMKAPAASPQPQNWCNTHSKPKPCASCNKPSVSCAHTYMGGSKQCSRCGQYKADGGVLDFNSYVTGGRVSGPDAQKLSEDNTFAHLQTGEYVIPRNSVQYYGESLFDDLRARRVPATMFDNPRGAYVPADGGGTCTHGQSQNIDKSTNFTGNITVQASDPNEMARKLAEQARLKALVRN